jgi:hypothetical protein
MEDSTIIFASLVGLLIWLLILNYIIRIAAKSALQFTEHYLKGLMRMKIKQMIKQGHSKEELQVMLEQSSEEFWNSL